MYFEGTSFVNTNFSNDVKNKKEQSLESENFLSLCTFY